MSKDISKQSLSEFHMMGMLAGVKCTINQLKPSLFVVAGESQKPVLTITHDGRIELGEGCTNADAAKATVEAMNQLLAGRLYRGPSYDFTAGEVHQVIDVALQRGTRLIPEEAIEQMRSALLALCADQ